jgi:hypothetical protein
MHIGGWSDFLHIKGFFFLLLLFFLLYFYGPTATATATSKALSSAMNRSSG